MGYHAGPEATPSLGQKSEPTTVRRDHGHTFWALRSMPGAEGEGLQEQPGRRIAGPGSELLLQLSPVQYPFAETCSPAQKQIKDGFRPPVRERTARHFTTVGVEQVRDAGEEDVGEDQKDDGYPEIASYGRPLGASFHRSNRKSSNREGKCQTKQSPPPPTP
jgi:hypothetical protein